MESLGNPKVGDKLAVHQRASCWGRAPHIENEIYSITRTTPTQVIAVKDGCTHEMRFRIKDGLQVNEHRPTYAVPLTPELIAQREEQVAALARWNAVAPRIIAVENAIRSRVLSIEQMEALAATFETFDLKD